MPEFIYTMRAVRKAHGDKVILDDVTLAFLPGAKIGVVGPNGTGKSTLLRMMAGVEQPSNGDARLMPGFTVGLLDQEPKLDETKTVLGNVEDGVAETKKLLDQYNEIAEKMATDYSDELLEEMGRLQEQLDHRDAWDLDSQVEQAMDALRCPPPDAEVASLSGGEKRRVALCRLLLSQPDLLLLDEPTNHLDAESVQWLEQHLEKYPGTVVAVTHDRYFLDDVAQWILELDRGHAYPYEGNYSTYLETKAARLKVEGAKDAKKRKRLEDELEWVRSSPRARQAKSRARLQRYEEMAAEADKSRKLDFEEIQIPPGPRLGSVVVEVSKLVKGFGDRCLFENLSFTLPRNGIVGVLGPNGVGKTTLFKMIVGEEKPDSGTIRIGETVSISYVDQARGRMDPNKNVWEVISDGEAHIRVGNIEIPSRAYVAAFGFKGADQQKLAGVMSGGERNRMNLALTLKQGGNLLLLDEPTNDLDVETLASLENALLEFPGCAVITSHDRWFLDRVATHILAWEGGANWFWFEGNFEAYEKNKIERLGAEAARPHRVTYRKLTRSLRVRRPPGWLQRPRSDRAPGLDVDQAVRGHDQVVPELGVQGFVQAEFVEGDPHVVQPRVSLGFADGEPGVPHPEPGVPAQLVVGARPTPVLHEEQPQVLLGGPEVPGRIDRPQHGIVRDALVEPVDQAGKGLFPAHGLVHADRLAHAQILRGAAPRPVAVVRRGRSRSRRVLLACGEEGGRAVRPLADPAAAAGGAVHARRRPAGQPGGGPGRLRHPERVRGRVPPRDRPDPGSFFRP